MKQKLLSPSSVRIHGRLTTILEGGGGGTFKNTTFNNSQNKIWHMKQVNFEMQTLKPLGQLFRI